MGLRFGVKIEVWMASRVRAFVSGTSFATKTTVEPQALAYMKKVAACLISTDIIIDNMVII